MQSVWVAANLIPWAHRNADLGFEGISGRPRLSPADQRRLFTVITRESLQDPAPLFNGYLAGGLLSKLSPCKLPAVHLCPALGQAGLQVGLGPPVSLTLTDTLATFGFHV